MNGLSKSWLHCFLLHVYAFGIIKFEPASSVKISHQASEPVQASEQLRIAISVKLKFLLMHKTWESYRSSVYRETAYSLISSFHSTIKVHPASGMFVGCTCHELMLYETVVMRKNWKIQQVIAVGHVQEIQYALLTYVQWAWPWTGASDSDEHASLEWLPVAPD
jgi:hypothetical protein